MKRFEGSIPLEVPFVSQISLEYRLYRLLILDCGASRHGSLEILGRLICWIKDKETARSVTSALDTDDGQ